jgi:hypothetical protein
MSSSSSRLSLPSMIRLLTSRGVSAKSAIEVCSKLVHAKYDTMEKLEKLTSFNLDDIDIKGADERKALLSIGGKGKGKSKSKASN